MSKLDAITPTGSDGKYKCELQVEGEWIALNSLSKTAIELLAEIMCSDTLTELGE